LIPIGIGHEVLIGYKYLHLFDKNTNPSLNQQLARFKSSDFCISSITVAELEFGISKSLHPDRNREALDQFLIPFDIVDFNQSVAALYGKIRDQLHKKGTLIGNMDLLISAHALSLNSTVLTNNEREFERIDGLKIENWTR
jgi:tRNA(fMet)-specific endonuclease VapC